jgi:hypothetical protein
MVDAHGTRVAEQAHTMQTPLSHHPFTPELFTRERRRTRLRQFLDSFEQQPWASVTAVPDFLSVKGAESQSKANEWVERAVR